MHIEVRSKKNGLKSVRSSISYTRSCRSWDVRCYQFVYGVFFSSLLMCEKKVLHMKLVVLVRWTEAI